MEGEPEPDPKTEPEATLFPAKVGEKLRAAREEQNLAIEEIAMRTRIPQRHLEAIERSNYSSLPSITYALGFAKAYARAVDMDEVEVARELRIELGAAPAERAPQIPSYQATYQEEDSARTPPSGMAWLGVIVAVLVLAGVGIWYGTDWFRGGASESEPLVIAEPTPTPSAAPTPESGGQVTLVARGKVWLRVTDANGNRLFEKELAEGERYDVPQDAQGPIVRTGLPDQIQVLLNGSEIAPLGTGTGAIEVPVSADALRARGSASPEAGTPTPAANAGPAPSPAPTPTPAAARAPAPSPVRLPSALPPPAVPTSGPDQP